MKHRFRIEYYFPDGESGTVNAKYERHLVVGCTYDTRQQAEDVLEAHFGDNGTWTEPDSGLTHWNESYKEGCGGYWAEEYLTEA